MVPKSIKRLIHLQTIMYHFIRFAGCNSFSTKKSYQSVYHIVYFSVVRTDKYWTGSVQTFSDGGFGTRILPTSESYRTV